MTGGITLAGVSKSFGARQVLSGLTLEVTPGSCLGLLGASGSGKTTLLRIIAGLERPDAGTVQIQGRVVDGGATYLAPHERHVGLVFQDLALWPHLTAQEHLALVARPLGLNRRARRQLVSSWLERVRLDGQARQRPDQLSGGEQQRLALARTLLPGPQILLLDEPFAGCDLPLVREMKDLVRRLHSELGLTTVLVSHDWRDMEDLVDDLALMRGGRIAVRAAASAPEARALFEGT